MIERLLFQAIQDGIADALANPENIRRYFVQHKHLSTTEADGINAWLATHIPTVIHNYPRQKEIKLPAYAVVLADEKETEWFLDRNGGIMSAEDLQTFNYDAAEVDLEVQASIFKSVFHIMVVTEGSPDTAIYLYELLKYFINRRHKWLLSCGISHIEMGGSDVMPDAESKPEHLFIRQLTLGVLAAQTQVEQATGPIISDVHAFAGEDPGVLIDGANATIIPVTE